MSLLGKKKVSLLMLAIVLVLVNPWIVAQTRNVIGQVNSFRTSDEGIPLPRDGTVIAGDVLQTARGGTATVFLSPKCRVVLAEETSVRFDTAQGRVIARISSGRLIIDAADADFPLTETGKYSIQPSAAGKAIYTVAVLPNERAVVSAHTGKIAVTEITSGSNVSVHEGEYAAMSGSKSTTSQPWQIARLPQGSSPENPQIPELRNSYKDNSRSSNDDSESDKDDNFKEKRQHDSDHDSDKDCVHRKSHHKQNDEDCHEEDRR